MSYGSTLILLTKLYLLISTAAPPVCEFIGGPFPGGGGAPPPGHRLSAPCTSPAEKVRHVKESLLLFKSNHSPCAAFMSCREKPKNRMTSCGYDVEALRGFTGWNTHSQHHFYLGILKSSVGLYTFLGLFSPHGGEISQLVGPCMGPVCIHTSPKVTLVALSFSI